MLNLLVSMISPIPLSPISDTLWSQRPPGGEEDQVPSHSSNPKEPSGGSIPGRNPLGSNTPRTPQRPGKSRKARLFRAVREVFHKSDFFLHGGCVYLNRLV